MIRSLAALRRPYGTLHAMTSVGIIEDLDDLYDIKLLCRNKLNDRGLTLHLQLVPDFKKTHTQEELANMITGPWINGEIRNILGSPSFVSRFGELKLRPDQPGRSPEVAAFRKDLERLLIKEPKLSSTISSVDSSTGKALIFRIRLPRGLNFKLMPDWMTPDNPPHGQVTVEGKLYNFVLYRPGRTSLENVPKELIASSFKTVAAECFPFIDWSTADLIYNRDDEVIDYPLVTNVTE